MFSTLLVYKFGVFYLFVKVIKKGGKFVNIL